MKVKEKISIILFPIVVFLAWLYWGIIEFGNAISTPEERMQPEIPHPKQPIDYALDSPLYILIGLAIYLLWRIIRANTKQRSNQ